MRSVVRGIEKRRTAVDRHLHLISIDEYDIFLFLAGGAPCSNHRRMSTAYPVYRDIMQIVFSFAHRHVDHQNHKFT